jgi:phosphoglucosamine mutase
MKRYPQVLVNVRVADRGRVATSVVLASAIADEEEKLGVNGRVLVRSSGTEPLIRVMVEASDLKVAQASVDRLVSVVEHEFT